MPLRKITQVVTGAGNPPDPRGNSPSPICCANFFLSNFVSFNLHVDRNQQEKNANRLNLATKKRLRIGERQEFPKEEAPTLEIKEIARSPGKTAEPIYGIIHYLARPSPKPLGLSRHRSISDGD